VATQPKNNNHMVKDFVLSHRTASIAWRPGHGQTPIVKELIASPNMKFVQLCIEKAYALTGLMSLSDSAEAIGAFNPYALVVVSDPSGASACQYGLVTKLYSVRFAEVCVNDGNGAAFCGGFLGEWLRSGKLPLSLAAGHRHGAAMASGNWATRSVFVRAVPAPASALVG